MNVNADALFRNLVINQHVNVVNRRQTLEINKIKGKGLEENNQNMESTSKETINLNLFNLKNY